MRKNPALIAVGLIACLTICQPIHATETGQLHKHPAKAKRTAKDVAKGASKDDSKKVSKGPPLPSKKVVTPYYSPKAPSAKVATLSDSLGSSSGSSSKISKPLARSQSVSPSIETLT